MTKPIADNPGIMMLKRLGELRLEAAHLENDIEKYYQKDDSLKCDGCGSSPYDAEDLYAVYKFNSCHKCMGAE